MSTPLNAPSRDASGASRKRLSPCVGAFAVALALAGCKMPTHPDSAAGPGNPLNPAGVQLLDDTSWVLKRAQTSDGRPALDVPAAQTAAPTLTLDTNSGQRRASGFAGCNRFSGTYNLASGNMTFGPLATTRKACGPDADRLEQAYLDALAHVGTTLVQMRPPQELRIIATTGLTLTFARESR